MVQMIRNTRENIHLGHKKLNLAKTQQEKDDEALKALVFVEEEVLHLNKDQIEETNENS